MAFDINNVLKEMTAAAISSLGNDVKKAGTQTDTLLAAHRETLKQISDLALSGDLTQEELRSEIADELLTFQSEMLASQVAGKAAVQRAANAASDILIKAVNELLP